MLKVVLSAAILCIAASDYPVSPTTLHYNLRVDPADLTGVSVELRISNAPASLQLAAHAHPEYDDRYWRYVHSMQAVSASGVALSVTPKDSVLWRLNNAAGNVTVRYRVRFPQDEAPRSSWKPFLAPTGGLIGGPHSFLYVVGQENSAVTVALDLPTGWKVGTGLAGPSSARAFQAANVHTLMESPMLVGRMSEWTFRAANIPHRIFFWRLPNAAPFDTVAFVRGIEKLATGTIGLFDAAPYDNYTFLMQDGAYSGGLEHPNSVTLGAPTADLARDPNAVLSETAHEFFHAWNLIAIKPQEYRETDYRTAPMVAELWFSEGLTMFYADLLPRRAGLPVDDSTRVAHLEHLIARYLAMPGNARFSAEAVSRAEYNAASNALGDYTASPHLQGELIGSMLDFRIRSATGGTRTIDDVMRRMYQRTRTTKFGNDDVEQAAHDVCACQVSDVFDRYVRNGNSIDFAGFLAPLGMGVQVSWNPAVDGRGKRQADLTVWAELRASERLLRLHVTNPSGAWGKAGLHTDDELVSINAHEPRTWPEFRRVVSALAIGDSVTVIVNRNGARFNARFVMAGYDAPRVRIEPIAQATEMQRRLQAAWMRGSARP